jgi:hypothetical protein
MWRGASIRGYPETFALAKSRFVRYRSSENELEIEDWLP